MLLEYFGEKFPRSQCDGTCDNCKYFKDNPPPHTNNTNANTTNNSSDMYSVPMTDYTVHAQALLYILRCAETCGQRVTSRKLIYFYARSKDKECTKFGQILNLDYNNCPELRNSAVELTLSKDLTDRLVQHMILENYISETHIANFGAFGADYIVEGEHGKKLLRKSNTNNSMYNYGVSTSVAVPKIMLPSSRTRKATDGIEGVTTTTTSSNTNTNTSAGSKNKSSKTVASGATQAIDIGDDDWCENTHKRGKQPLSLVCFLYEHIICNVSQCGSKWLITLLYFIF